MIYVKDNVAGNRESTAQTVNALGWPLQLISALILDRQPFGKRLITFVLSMTDSNDLPNRYV